MLDDNGVNLSSGMVAKTNLPYTSIPEFEQPIAHQQVLQKGNDMSDIASVDTTKPGVITVDRPNYFTPQVAAHELVHAIQNQTGGGTQVNINASSNRTAAYDYGGTEGLAAHFKSGKTVADLNMEQQASIPQNYMDEYRKAVKAGDAKAVDKLNAVYQPAIQQLRNMANPSRTQISTTPAAPGPPPSALTGLATALPGMYSSSTPMAQLPIPHLSR